MHIRHIKSRDFREALPSFSIGSSGWLSNTSTDRQGQCSRHSYNHCFSFYRLTSTLERMCEEKPTKVRKYSMSELLLLKSRVYSFFMFPFATHPLRFVVSLCRTPRAVIPEQINVKISPEKTYHQDLQYCIINYFVDCGSGFFAQVHCSLLRTTTRRHATLSSSTHVGEQTWTALDHGE